MDDATERLYDEITAAYEKWKQLDQVKHLLCPKVDDEDEEDYGSSGPPLTNISVAERETRIQDAQERKELTYQLSLLMGISSEMSVGWIDPWKKGTEKFLTTCDSCILNYHMYRKAFLKKLRE